MSLFLHGNLHFGYLLGICDLLYHRSRSIVAPFKLFTETGLQPLCARRLVLTLRYLIYICYEGHRRPM